MSGELRGVKLNYDYGAKLWRVGVRDEVTAQAKAEAVLARCKRQDNSFQYRLINTGELRENLDVRYNSRESASVLSLDSRLRSDRELLYKALDEGQIDFFVDEASSLPYQLPPAYQPMVLPPRGDARDVLVLRKGRRLETLPPASTVGLSRGRCEAILRRLRPDLHPIVEQVALLGALGRVRSGELDAYILPAHDLLHGEIDAYLRELVLYPFAVELFCPAPGQGQMVFAGKKSEKADFRDLRAHFDDHDSRSAYQCECEMASKITGIYRDVNHIAAVHVYYDGQGRPRLSAVNTQSEKRPVHLAATELSDGNAHAIDKRKMQIALNDLLGEVHFVGGGPGPADLLTLRGRDLIRSADLILYDNPGAAAILAQCETAAEQIDLSRDFSETLEPEPDFASDKALYTMLDASRRGLTVVRLCIGDPWLLGPAAAEALVLARSGIRYSLAPGVSAALAAPAYAAVPLNLSGIAESVHILNGLHPCEDRASDIDEREALRRLISLGGTLVFLMPVTGLPELSSKLIDAGLAPHTQCLLISSAGGGRQRQLGVRLDELPVRAVHENILPPASLILSPNLRYSRELAWWPPAGRFSGHTVLLLKSRSFERSSREIRRRLEHEGAMVEEIELTRHVRTPESDRRFAASLMRILERSGQQRGPDRGTLCFAFSSGTAVRAFRDVLQNQRWDLRRLGRCRIAAYGESSLDALRETGLEADYVPAVADMESMASLICSKLNRRDTLVYVRGSLGSSVLGVHVKLSGIAYEELIAYETAGQAAGEKTLLEMLPRASAILFGSAAAVHAFYDWHYRRIASAPILPPLIPITAAAASVMESRMETPGIPVMREERRAFAPDDLYRRVAAVLDNRQEGKSGDDA